MLYIRTLNVTTSNSFFSDGPRIIGVELEIDKEKYTVVNCYGPANRQERPFFFDSLNNVISNLFQNNLIICGDFNMVQNNSLDIIECYPHGQKETETFVSIIKSWDLWDTWRKANWNNINFTWSRKNSFYRKKIRLHLLRLHPKPQGCKISLKRDGGYGLQSRGNRILKNERGPSTLKFNTSYLKVLAFVQQINACISKSLVESQREGLDGITTCELLKATIRSECMLCSRNKDNETNKPSRFTLERELTHLSALISRSPTDHRLITNYGG